MADTPSIPPEKPEFSHVIEVAQLRDGLDFDIAPTPAQAAALARLMDASALRKMRFRGRLSPLGARGWELDATLGATVVQPCVVTLEPVTTRIDQPVHRRFLPLAGPASTEIRLDAEEDDALEPLGDRIDLGLVATEALALALPAYPRKPGAELPAGAPEDTGDTDEVIRPFAALAALRKRPGDDP